MHMSFSILILMQILIILRVLFGVYFTSFVHYVKAFLGYHCCTNRLIVASTPYCTWGDGPITEGGLNG